MITEQLIFAVYCCVYSITYACALHMLITFLLKLKKRAKLKHDVARLRKQLSAVRIAVVKAKSIIKAKDNVPWIDPWLLDNDPFEPFKEEDNGQEPL